MTKQETIEKGRKASDLLETMQPFADEYGSALMTQWKLEQSAERREALWHKLDGLSSFMNKLTVFAKNGESAFREVEKINGR